MIRGFRHSISDRKKSYRFMNYFIALSIAFEGSFILILSFRNISLTIFPIYFIFGLLSLIFCAGDNRRLPDMGTIRHPCIISFNTFIS